MSSIIGSCFGSFSASCLSGLMNPSSGDFRSSHRQIPPTIDYFLAVAPFILSFIYPDIPSVNRFLTGYVISLIMVQSMVVAAPQEMNKRYYGIRIAVPTVFGLVYMLVSIYYPTEIGRSMEFCLSLFGTAGLAFVTAVSVSDLGFGVNGSIRHHLEGLGNEMYMRQTVKIMIIAVCMLPIFFALRAEFPFGYMHTDLLLGVIILSIVSFPYQRGSIVSAALTVYTLAAIHIGILPLEAAIIFSLFYNTYILNRSKRDTEMLPDLPLLDDTALPSPLSLEERSNVRFKYFASNMVLLSFFTLPHRDMAEIFFLVATLTSLWILIAPIILTNRYFPY
jgi:hypothetical protein